MEKKVKEKKNKKVKYKTAEQEEMVKFFWVIVVVLLCVGAVYLLTRAFVTKDLFDKKEETTEEVVEGSVNYSVAIVGQILNRPYDEYYVVVFNSEGDYYSDMTSLVSSYNMLDNHLHVYVVDLANKLNEGYYDAENVNTKAISVSEFKFGDITLIKVKKGQVNKYITDYAKMQKELKVS